MDMFFLCVCLMNECMVTRTHTPLPCAEILALPLSGEKGWLLDLEEGVSCQEWDRGGAVSEMTNLSSLSFQSKDPGIARLLWEVLACLSLFIPFSLWGAIGNGSPQSGQTMVVSRRRGWSLTKLPPSIPHFCLPLSCYCLREGWLGQVVSPLHPPNGLLLGARGKRGMELQGQDFS